MVCFALRRPAGYRPPPTPHVGRLRRTVMWGVLMKLQKIVVLVLILGLASACTREGETTPPSTVETPTSQTPITLTNNWNGYFLPKYETQQEKRERGGKADDIDDFMVANKEWYKITVPPQNPQNIRFPGEFEPMGYLLVGWIDGTLDQFFTDLVKGAWGYTTVILVNPGGSAQANMLQKLQSAGIPSSELTDGNHLVWLNAQLDSIWARDFGPQPVIHTDTGKMSVIDTRYYHYRYLDDIIPTYIGDGLGVNVFRASIEQEGGNFQANGTGHCFTSRGSIYRNTPDPDEAGHKKLYLDYFGCKELHFLFPLEGEGTTHIDMFMMVIGEKDIIVGEYSEANDCINRELLEKNVATLSGIKDADGNQMFRIHRIPMPPNSDGIWRTFTNFQMVRNPNDPSKGVVLVPVYAKYPTYQQEMLTKMAAAFQTESAVIR